MGNWGRCRFVEKEKKKKRDENFKAAEWEFGKVIFLGGFCDFLPGGFEIEMDLSLLGDICKNTKSATSFSLHLLAQVVLPWCVYWLLITQRR